MAINRNRKGKAFEQFIAHLLTEKSGKAWHRTPLSGMLRSIHDDDAVWLRGDCYSLTFPEVLVECKSIKNVTLNEIFRKPSKFWKWVKKAQEEARGDDFMVFIKPNNAGVFVISNSAGLLHKMGFSNHNEVRINGFYTMLKV